MYDSNISQILIANSSDFLRFVQTQLVEDLESPIESQPNETLSEFSNRVGNKVNIMLLTTPATKKEIGVEEIIPVLGFAQIKPNLQPKAYLLISPAEQLNIAAQNKLLKLLEEPPQFLQIYLQVKQPTNLLVTIRSRCLITRLDPAKSANSFSSELSQEFNIDAEVVNNLFTVWEKFLDRDKFDAYEQLQSIIAAQETGASKGVIFEVFTKIVNSSIFSPRLSMQQQQLLMNLTTNIHKSVGANVNTKLLTDRIFLELQAIV